VEVLSAGCGVLVSKTHILKILRTSFITIKFILSHIAFFLSLFILYTILAYLNPQNYF